MRPNHPVRARLARAMAILAVLIILAACGGAASAPDGGLDGGAGNPDGNGAAGSGNGAGTGSGSGGTSGNGSNAGSGSVGGTAQGPILEAARPDLLIIKTGTLELQVEDVDIAVGEASARVVALGGYASGSSQSGGGESVTASITFRIPVEAWERALRELRELAIEVIAEQTQSDDVTGQVVDLAARITNLQATERAFQAIMDQARTIEDILQVQAELTSVRGQIEQAASQRQRLTEQAAFSTLTVRFGMEPEPAVAVAQAGFDPQAEVDRATATIVGVLQGLATAGIWFGIVWLPMLLVVGLVAVIARLLLRNRLPGRAPDGWGGPGASTPPPADPPEPAAA
ncbi:MAG TPA: DUF4349 domain-containing protein [Candidatus Limnocylindrales bacterium]|nr:DUF4349 domain-containing protein [Candidatus Limnocylindrales bacterium]